MAGSTIVIGIAWLLYTASWFFQVIRNGTTLSSGGLPGWEAFVTALTPEGGLVGRILSVSSSLTNFLMILSPAILFWRRFDNVKHALLWLLILAAILDAQWLSVDARAGYYLWWASFVVLAIGCFLLQRSGRAAKATSGNGED